MDKVVLRDLDGVKVGFSGKKLGSVQILDREVNAEFEEFISHFPAKIVYDMPAVGKDHVIRVDGLTPEQVWGTEADALITENPDVLLTLRAADCIPVVFYVPGQKILGLAHVGTSGAVLHLPRQTLQKMNVRPEEVKVYVGPSISKESYRFPPDYNLGEKGLNPSWDKYISRQNDEIHIDLLGYVIDELKTSGVKSVNIQSENIDTGADADYFSHRRHRLTGETSGRNAIGVTLI